MKYEVKKILRNGSMAGADKIDVLIIEFKGFGTSYIEDVSKVKELDYGIEFIANNKSFFISYDSAGHPALYGWNHSHGRWGWYKIKHLVAAVFSNEDLLIKPNTDVFPVK